MRTLQRQLNLGMGLLLGVVFLALGLLYSQALQHVVEEYILVRLQNDSETILSSIERNDNTWQYPANIISDAYQRPFSGFYYTFQVDNQNNSSPSAWEFSLPIPDGYTGQVSTQRIHGPLNQVLFVRTAFYQKSGSRIAISVAQDIADLEQDARHTLWLFTGLTMATLAFILIVQTMIIRRSLLPVHIASEQLAAMQSGNLGKLDENVPGEIRPLVVQINRLVDLLDKRLSRSRNAMGNLAHAYKAPLTVIKQLLHEKGQSANQDLTNKLSYQLDLLSSLTERELKKARIAGKLHSTQARFLPERDLPPLLDTFSRIYHERNVKVVSNINTEICPAVDRDDMLELLGNLLDNAYKWSSDRIEFTWDGDSDYLYCTISDDGPGVRDEKLLSILQRGERLDESIEGHGLGLAIAKEVVNQYGGKFNLQNSSSGGLCASFSLPLSIP